MILKKKYMKNLLEFKVDISQSVFLTDAPLILCLTEEQFQETEEELSMAAILCRLT